ARVRGVLHDQTEVGAGSGGADLVGHRLAGRRVAADGGGDHVRDERNVGEGHTQPHDRLMAEFRAGVGDVLGQRGQVRAGAVLRGGDTASADFQALPGGDVFHQVADSLVGGYVAGFPGQVERLGGHRPDRRPCHVRAGGIYVTTGEEVFQ